MTLWRVAFAAVLFLALSTDIGDAVTLSPCFTKRLVERIATLDADVAAYPELTYAALMLPDQVSMWESRSLSECKTELEKFEALVKTEVKSMLMSHPADNVKINKFNQDATDFIQFFYTGIESGDVVSSPTTTRSATKEPRGPTVTPSAGSGSEQEDVPYTYTPYTYTPRTTYPPYWTPSPLEYYYDNDTSVQFAAWKIGLIVVSIIFFAIRMMCWSSKRHAKKLEMKAAEEAAAAAALQAEEGEGSRATYLAIAEANEERHFGRPAKV